MKKIMGFKRNSGRLVIDGEVFEKEFCIIAVAFGDSMGGYKIWPENNIDIGDFGVVFGYDYSRLGLLKLMLKAKDGKHINEEGVTYTRGKKLSIELETEWPFQFEGEIPKEGLAKVNITYVDNGINILV
ncbi:MAG: hypothetical protein OEY49_15885 [Candidatus Heimdallarchaeota archaeon]|nr:hypothetical protein [Candidatus Heimdallarchaeota archaeon]